MNNSDIKRDDQEMKSTVRWKRQLCYYLILLCILAPGYCLFLFTSKVQDRRAEIMMQEYPSINRIDGDIRGVVIYSEPTLLLNNTSIIELNNSIQFRLTDTKSNHNLKPNRLQDFLRVGDSIVRPQDTDSLYVFRKTEEYIFLLRSDVAYHP